MIKIKISKTTTIQFKQKWFQKTSAFNHLKIVKPITIVETKIIANEACNKLELLQKSVVHEQTSCRPP